jgi:UTRA domain-containing protein
VPCPPADAKLLDIRGGSPVLQIHRTTIDTRGRPFEYLESFFRGDRYVFQAELTSQDPAARGAVRESVGGSDQARPS